MNNQCCAKHDRLDLFLHVDEYIRPLCGSPTNSTVGQQADGKGAPRYCCGSCPTFPNVIPIPPPEAEALPAIMPGTADKSRAI